MIDYTNSMIFDYYVQLESSIKDSECLEDVMECLFKSLEAKEDVSVDYGLAVLSSEQFNNDKAHTALNVNYFKRGMELINEVFSMCIANGWARPFDVAAGASFVMNGVLSGVLVRVNECMGKAGAYDSAEMFESLKTFLLSVLKA